MLAVYAAINLSKAQPQVNKHCVVAPLVQAAFRLHNVLRDGLLPANQEWLVQRFRAAAKKRWQALAASCSAEEDALPEMSGAVQWTCAACTA